MAAPVPQSGAMIPCPRCGTEVMQKEMIPLSVTDGVIAYSCVPCARTLVATGTGTEAGGTGATTTAS